MSGAISGYTEVRELEYRLSGRTVLAIHDATVANEDTRRSMHALKTDLLASTSGV